MKILFLLALLGAASAAGAASGHDLGEDAECLGSHQADCRVNLACAVDIDTALADGAHTTSLCVPKAVCGGGGTYPSASKGQVFVLTEGGTCVDSKYNTAFDFVYDYFVDIKDGLFDKGTVGYMIEGDFDVSAGYGFPWYSDGYYIGFDLAPNLRWGGDVHIQFDMYMFKVHFWIAGIFADL